MTVTDYVDLLIIQERALILEAELKLARLERDSERRKRGYTEFEHRITALLD